MRLDRGHYMIDGNGVLTVVQTRYYIQYKNARFVSFMALNAAYLQIKSVPLFVERS